MTDLQTSFLLNTQSGTPVIDESALPPRTRATDPETSQEAEDSLNLDALLGLALIQYADPQNADGLIADDLDRITGRTGLWRRAGELRNLGLIEYKVVDGKFVKRAGRSRRNGFVCVITELGRKQFKEN